MQLTGRQIIEAVAAIRELRRSLLPYPLTREIVQWKRWLEAELETIAAQEEALIVRYGGQREKKEIRFADESSRAAYAAEIEAMLDSELTCELPPVDLSAVQDELRVSVAQLEALDGVVVFAARG